MDNPRATPAGAPAAHRGHGAHAAQRAVGPFGILALVSAVLVAACAAAGPTPSRVAAGSAAPGASSACPAAPDPGQPAGWGMPSAAPAVIPILINPAGELTCGMNRLVFSFVDGTGRPMAKPDRTASIALYNLARDTAKPAATVQGTFIWAIEGSIGIYVAAASFSEAGVWGAEFSTAAGGATSTIRMTFSVSPSSGVVRVGQAAPASKTATGDPSGISTDPKPEPAFYTTSVDSAIAGRKPFVLAFATPKFCTSGQCGPTLERIKPFVARYPTVTFINVEPYVLKQGATGLEAVLTQNNLTPAQPTVDWGLLTEPWVFVVDRLGIVRASFELIFSDAELTAALDAVK